MAARRRRLGVRARVVASFLVLLVAAEVVSIVVLRQVGTARIEDQADRDLVAAADDLRSRLDGLPIAVGAPGGPLLSTVFDEFLRSRPGREDEAYLTIVDGRPLAASSGAPTPLATLPVAGSWLSTRTSTTGRAATPAGEMRWIAVPVLSGEQVAGVLVATEFLRTEQDALTGTIVRVGAVTVLVLAGACLLAWGAAGRALRPLHVLAGTARSVSGGRDLSRRIEVDRGDEIGDVAEALNEMLDRLESAFDSQQRFLDDAGHELRTPITIVRGHLELLDDDPEERARDIALVLDELDRMDRLVGELRTVARSGRPDFVVPEPVDVPALLDELGRKARAMADREWRVAAPDVLVVAADRQRLSEAMLNLVDNAVDATGPGDVIELGAATDDGGVELWVRDEGCGIAAAEIPLLLERGPRRTHRRAGGTGLGLPIVDGIARAHGGSVGVDSTPGAGTRIAIRFPAPVELDR